MSFLGVNEIREFERIADEKDRGVENLTKTSVRLPTLDRNFASVYGVTSD
jgi:hypothetical protein